MSSSNTSSINTSSSSVSPPPPSAPPPSGNEKPPSAFLLPESETAKAPEVSNPQSPPPPSSPPPSPPPISPPPTPPPSSPPPPNDPPPSSPPPSSPPPPNDPPPAPVTSPSPPPPQGDSLPMVNLPVSPPPPFPSPPPPVVWYQLSQSENSLSPLSPGSSGFSPPVQFPPPPTANPSTLLPGSQTGPTWSPPPSIPSPDSASNLTPLVISNPSPKSGNNRGVVIGAAAAAMGVLVLALFAFLFFMVKKKKRGFSVHYGPTPGNVIVQPDGYFYAQQPQNLLVGRSDGFYNGRPPLSPTVENHNGSSGPDSGVIGLISCFSYEDLMEITNGFSKQNILGQGGFGYVYKGWLLDGRAVAVKQLKTGSNQGEREFRSEVEIISRIHHRHLVSLVGYCIAENQRLLVYEFLSNNNLDHHLHGKGMPVMEWPKRLKIALGAARGLAYLHDDCNPKIIHRDIKSANILLDDAFEVQLSDFGLAKLAIGYDTHVSTRVVGTVGYMAPEYATSGKLTDRSDVYSFGVVLLELVTGRKAIDPTQPLGDESLVEWKLEHNGDDDTVVEMYEYSIALGIARTELLELY